MVRAEIYHHFHSVFFPFVTRLWTTLLNLFPHSPRLVDMLSEKDILNTSLIKSPQGPLLHTVYGHLALNP